MPSTSQLFAMHKILGIHGSPRLNGNTDILLDEALMAAMSAGGEVEKIRLAELTFEGCRSCGGCDVSAECIVKDDLQQLYSRFIEFDRFILATPIFFKGVSGLTKNFIDRFQCHWVGKYRLKEVPWDPDQKRMGAFISTCGAESKEMFTPAVATVKAWLVTLDIEYKYELLASGMDAKGEVSLHQELLEQARELGKNLEEEP
jgi:multimeric flavodoxin WrbA